MKTFGIDISKWQKGINLTLAKNEGVKFAILRGAYSNSKDTQFETHYKNAKANNLGVGVYQWTRAITPSEAVKEAQYLIENVLDGKTFEYPIYIDVEDSKLSGLSKAKIDAIITAWCLEIEKAGYFAGFYCNNYWFTKKMNGSKLAERFTNWIAYWTATTKDYPMWQFGGETNKIRTNKVAGKVCDQNYCSVDFPSLIMKKKLNSVTEVKAEVKDTNVYYTVIKGDWVRKVARKTGVNYKTIIALNNLKGLCIIKAGEILRIK